MLRLTWGCQRSAVIGSSLCRQWVELGAVPYDQVFVSCVTSPETWYNVLYVCAGRGWDSFQAIQEALRRSVMISFFRPGSCLWSFQQAGWIGWLILSSGLISACELWFMPDLQPVLRAPFPPPLSCFSLPPPPTPISSLKHAKPS